MVVACGIAAFLLSARLRRREESLDGLGALSVRLRGSLLITSASAFPTDIKFSDWRKVTLERDGLGGLVSDDMRTRIEREGDVNCQIGSEVRGGE